MHATEAGRHSGWVYGPISRQVHAVESWLARESDALITCSASMAEEIAALFGPDCPTSPSSPTGSIPAVGLSRGADSTPDRRAVVLRPPGDTRRACMTPSPPSPHPPHPPQHHLDDRR